MSFSDVVIDKETKLNLIKELFTTAGLPYRVLYEEAGFDFDSIKLVREEENEDGMDETFKIHSMPFSGNQDQTDGDESQDPDDKGGRPKKTMTERKTDKTTSNNSQPRTNLQNTNRSA